VAAVLRRELDTDVDMVHGRYGEFRILVDGDEVVDAGPMAALGIVPSSKGMITAVRKRLARI
jgi:hypothetical protein